VANSFQNRNLSGVYVRARAITEKLLISQAVSSTYDYNSHFMMQTQNQLYNLPQQPQFVPVGANLQPPMHYEAYDNTAVYPEYVIIAHSL